MAAIATLDGCSAYVQHPDSAYVGRRRQIFVVAVNCTEPGGLCFCASMGTGPAVGPGYDLSLTERLDGDGLTYLVDVGTHDGADVLAAITAPTADAGEIDSAASRCADAATPDGPRRCRPSTCASC